MPIQTFPNQFPSQQPTGTVDDPVFVSGRTTGTETLYPELAGNGASQVALPANPLRKKACIVNAATSTSPIWLAEGVTAEPNKGKRLDPGSAYNWDSLNPYYGEISFFAASTATISRSES